MKDVDLKKLGTLRLCGGGALVALATWGVWAFCGGGFSAPSGWESAFDGWRYGREDQKAASAALAAAGLDEWSWDDGRLLVPKNKKNEYQTTLAEAGAYPKAPSESRRDAIREMGAFESDAKLRMRELDACAFQLEQTLERTGGIEYATVGVRARREQAGLTAKTVVTASIGVARREGRELDANLLSAITVAAKHQLGVDANENISILDLKAGKSYFGSEKQVGNGSELALASEKDRVETYWRDKFLKTFDYMEGIRVSVAAELVVAEPNDLVRTTEIGDVGGELDDLSAKNGDEAKSEKIAKNKRATSAAERLAQVEIGKTGEIGKPRPLATWNDDLPKSARNGGAFARLGNPVATRNPVPVEAQNLANVERRADGNGVLSVGATERRDAPKRGVVSAGYRQETENKEDGQVERVAQGAKEESIKENERGARSETVAQDGKIKETNENKDGVVEGVKKDEERVRFRVRALAVRIGTPRGYVRRVAQNLKAENAAETFATDETAGSWNDFYRTTEQKILAETKKVALLLLRPLAERNGWTENELTRSVAVDVFADPNDWAERSVVDERAAEERPNAPFEVVANFGRIADTSERVAEETTVDEPTSEEEKATAEATEEKTAAEFWTVWKERALQLDPKTKTGVAVGGGILAALTLAAGATAARRRKKSGVDSKEKTNDETSKRTSERNQSKKGKRREEKNTSNKEDGKDAPIAETNDAFDDGETTLGRREREERTFERNLRIARTGGKAAFAQENEFEKWDEDARNEAETRQTAQESGTRNARISQIPQIAQNRQFRRFPSPAQSKVDANGWNARSTSEKAEDFESFDEFDDWDELDDDLLEIRSLIERERARVGETSTETVKTNGGDATRRREALDLVARNPERAAASLRRWLRPGA